MTDETMTTSLQAGDILRLFNLQDKNIEKINVTHQQDGMHIFVILTSIPHTCPVCGHITSKVKDYYTRKITHSILNRTPCYIEYKARRFVCPHCHKTFYEHNPFTMNGMQISLETVYNILTDLRNPRTTFTEVAHRYNVSSTTAASVFDKHVHISRRPLPQYLCLDEVYSFQSHNSKYVCVLLDYSSQKIVDLLPSRHKNELINYLSFIPREERSNVKLCSFDMWDTYRIVCKMMFPNALCCIDHFHVIQELNRQLDKVRIRVMNKTYAAKKQFLKKGILSKEEKTELEETSKKYYVLKKFNWMFFTNNNKIFDPNIEKKYNTVLGRYMNWYDIYSYMVDIDNELDIAADLKHQMILFYQKADINTARDILNEIIRDMQNSSVSEMNTFANTIIRWKTEIINSFTVIGERVDKKGNVIKQRINNGIIENRNKSIKLLKHSSNGYLNWSRFRNRVLYCLNDDTTYFMYPYFNKKD